MRNKKLRSKEEKKFEIKTTRIIHLGPKGLCERLLRNTVLTGQSKYNSQVIFMI